MQFSYMRRAMKSIKMKLMFKEASKYLSKRTRKQMVTAILFLSFACTMYQNKSHISLKKMIKNPKGGR